MRRFELSCQRRRVSDMTISDFSRFEFRCNVSLSAPRMNPNLRSEMMEKNL